MATFAHNVIDNFRYRLETLTPTAGGRPFRFADPFADEIGNQSGSKRRFFVAWTGSGPDTDLTDMRERTAEHDYVLTVFYPTANQNFHELTKLVLQDRHDIVDLLRDPTSWVGTDADNTTTALGIYHRMRSGDELTLDDDVWSLEISWTITLNEVE